ncbi:cell division protein FtsW [Vitreoscilla filiformis]|jgi:cell division protein FtsW|uniref:Probable peptidoglycan glycosyltransferase FtsW n=1 Tax=Vitreoscilla filiformis TaxID=63 RepID=A0A221KB85_VITFI|nr:putative lipid II flippase FtsW [Vitreoscilla filiformis]ASM76291.1 cell division protein FtsW [Vitreoscilla filiformis]
MNTDGRAAERLSRWAQGWQARAQSWFNRSKAPSDGRVSLPIREWMPTRDANLSPLSTHGFDSALIWVVMGLVLLGVVMVFSASVALPDNPRFRNYEPTHFLMRQSIALVLGVIVAALTLQVPIATWEKWAPWLFGASIVALVLVLVVGTQVNGSRRWIRFAGFNLQPSEITKLTMAMYAASYMVRKMDVKERFFKAVWPMAVALGVVGILLLAEPDMGAFIVIAAVALGILFLGGVNGRMFMLSVAVLLGVFMLMIVFSEFRRKRIFAYLDPWAEENAKGAAYQLTHSLMAFGRGEWFGQGLGLSLEKLSYLPEAHTDFLLAVIGEELGLVTVTAVIVAFFWLTRRIFIIGRQAIMLDRVFAGLMAQGIGLWIASQAVINIGVNLGALPTKGLTLPLLSYGGSGLILNLVALSIVLRVDQENRQLMRGGRS